MLDTPLVVGSQKMAPENSGRRHSWDRCASNRYQEEFVMINRLRYLGRRRQRGWFLIVAVMSVLLLAGCAGAGGLLEAELPDDGPPPATSAASAGRFVQKVTAAGEGAANTGR